MKRVLLTPEQRRERKALVKMRGGLRRLWMWYSPARKEAHRRAKTPDGWVCALCRGMFKAKDTAVDHIDPCGGFHSFGEDMVQFFAKLNTGADGLRVLCTPCHTKVTNEQKAKAKGATCEK